MAGFLGELEAAGGNAESIYVPPGLSPTEIEDRLEKIFGRRGLPSELAELMAASETGTVLFWGQARKCLVSPPFPITEAYSAHGYAVERLRSMLSRDFTVALVLVRLGAYAIGICHGEKIIASKTGTGLVHARHKKGGSSQGRFARHREKQIEYFLERVCGHIRERFEPHARTLDYMVYGGARTTITSLRKRCPFLEQFDHRTLPPLLDIPEPRQAVLETAIGTVWSSQVTEWREE